MENKNNILGLSSLEARKFLLKNESYCNFDLPHYFDFEAILTKLDKTLTGKDLKTFCLVKTQPKDYDKVNYEMFANKDGKYAWRPFQLIHPALYVSLVHTITNQDNWNIIRERFKLFSQNPKIECISLPVVSKTEQSDKAEQIINWWENIEQRSIELALDYNYIAHTDISDCYGSIYTHSIAWSLHDKDVCKKNLKKPKSTKKNLLGDSIDELIRNMSHGQTNGLPQGSTLMDFIAEMVLGYADTLLTKSLNETNIEKYKILRYRDDYRIFVNNPIDAEKILRSLTEVLIGLGLKLNPTKTFISDNIISSAVKADKTYWLSQPKQNLNLQKSLSIIRELSIKYPNSGSLKKSLEAFFDKVDGIKKLSEDPLVLISIVTDIAFRNPNIYPISSAILSQLIDLLEEAEKLKTISRIREKFKSIPNSSFANIWLQRVTYHYDSNIKYNDSLSAVLKNSGNNSELWNSDWLKDGKLKNLINNANIINTAKLEKSDPVISKDEVELFKKQQVS